MGETIIKLLNSAVNIAALFCFAVCIVVGVYGIWDAKQTVLEADSFQYQQYQPKENDKDNFEELQKKNPDVIGWLTIDGTSINYPIVHCSDNQKYVNTNAKGEYSQTGSLFLDYRNKEDFSSANNIIYGHHMEEGKMFGDLDRFLEASFFEKNMTGKLYFDQKYYSLKILAISKTSAYDQTIYKTELHTEDEIQELKQKLQACAVNQNELEILPGERFVLLSTCDAGQTNGRIVLVTKMLEK